MLNLESTRSYLSPAAFIRTQSESSSCRIFLTSFFWSSRQALQSNILDNNSFLKKKKIETQLQYDAHNILMLKDLVFLTATYPAGNYMFKINNRNTRTRSEICSKLTIKTAERRQSRL